MVVVAGPDHLHAEQTLLALAGGCHVLVEKPMAICEAAFEAIETGRPQTPEWFL